MAFEVIILALVAYLIASLRKVSEDELVVVIRFGQPVRSAGPGLCLVLFGLETLVRYPSIKLESETSSIDVATATGRDQGQNPIGRTTIKLLRVSFQAQFDVDRLVDVPSNFPKPPKRGADGKWEAFDHEWASMINRIVSEASRQAAGSLTWEQIFDHRDQLGQQVTRIIITRFPCFHQVEVVVGSVDLGESLKRAIAAEEHSLRQARAAAVDAESYAATRVRKAHADKRATALEGEGTAQAMAAQVQALGGDVRNFAAVKLAESGSTVILPSGLIDAMGRLGGASAPTSLPTTIDTKGVPVISQQPARLDGLPHSLQAVLAAAQGAGITQVVDLLPLLPPDQVKIFSGWLKGESVEVDATLSIHTALSVLSPRQKRAVLNWMSAVQFNRNQ